MEVVREEQGILVFIGEQLGNTAGVSMHTCGVCCARHYCRCQHGACSSTLYRSPCAMKSYRKVIRARLYVRMCACACVRACVCVCVCVVSVLAGAQENPGSPEEGSRVRLHGLTGAADLNDAVGQVRDTHTRTHTHTHTHTHMLAYEQSAAHAGSRWSNGLGQAGLRDSRAVTYTVPTDTCTFMGLHEHACVSVCVCV